MEIKKFTFKFNQDFFLPEGWMPFQVDDIPETGRVYIWAYRPIIKDVPPEWRKREFPLYTLA